jgi:hypothetical protein
MLLFRRSRKMPPSWSGVAWVSELSAGHDSCGTRKSEPVRAGVVVGWAALDACNWSEMSGSPLGARLRAGIARGWKGVEPLPRTLDLRPNPKTTRDLH